MNDTIFQSLMSLLSPGQDESVSLFVQRSVRALGGKTDATLADTMGLPRSTIANWKRRNRVADDYIDWFRTTLAEKIALYARPPVNVTIEARAAVLNLIAKTDGDPVGAGLKTSASALYGLLALSQFLFDRIYDTCRDESEATIERVTDLLDAAMPMVRRAF
ncbi:MAG: helix-turn-helix domain-containing protein [Blastomonas fulva]|uniref:helix-turn-helix domain-containing protein n=1 Tax=Blastomonas fulva TaxID=1550728 RepID=UPI004033BF82